MCLKTQLFRLFILTIVCFSAISNAFSATYTVTNREDESPATVGSLRWAVEQANLTTAADLINFNISGSNSITAIFNFGIYEINHPVEINSGGNQIIGGGFSFNAGSDGSTLTGIALVSASVGIGGSANCLRVYNCRIGTDWDDNDGIELECYDGILLSGNYHYIGGSTAGERNVISNNWLNGSGITISGNNSIIQGNYIGVNSTGSMELANGTGLIISGNNNLIGGNRSAGEGNLISGNRLAGIVITGVGNTLCGNIIGLNATQTAAFSNNRGIHLQAGGNYNWIGLSQAGKGNIISGNGTGIDIENANYTLVQNNIIGLSDSDSSFGNGEGIVIGGQNNIIGGFLNDTYHERNIISGNGVGIAVGDNGNTVSGNIVGLTSDGITIAGNSTGISFNGGNNLIGGWNQDQNHLRGNVISGNGQYDIQVFVAAGNIVGNYIGLDVTGTQVVPNINLARVYLTNASIVVGGLNSEERNYICGNNQNGIRVASHNNQIINNWIGLLPDGTVTNPNFTNGIYFTAGSNNRIGLQGVAGSGNLIAGPVNGISVNGAGTDYNSFYGNTISAFTGTGILLDGLGANENKAAPAIILPADVHLIQGTTTGTDDYIEVFISDRGAGVNGGSLRLVGSTTAVSGNWSVVPSGLSGGEYVTAIATDSSGNSSGFSLNQQVLVPTPTASPTVTPTATPTPAAIVDIYRVEPEYHHAIQTVSLAIYGNNFSVPTSVRLSRAGMSDIQATEVQVIDVSRLRCKLDLSGLAYGDYTIRVDITGAYGIKNNALKVIQQVNPPYQWNITDIGQAGATAQTEETRGVWVADGDNDGQQEVFSAGLLQNILKYDLAGSAWSVNPLPAGGIGEYYSSVLVYDMENDGQFEVYGSTLDNHVYSFSGANFATKTDLAGDLGYPVYALAYGDADQDNVMELYAVSGNNDEGYVHQFNYAAGWSNTIVAQTTERMTAVVCADGNNDNQQELYVACADNNLFEIKYNGGTWTKSIVANGGGAMRAVAVGDGNQDGENEVYFSNQDGNLYQAKWTSSFFWDTTQIAALDVRGLLVGDADNNGTTEVYAAAEDGHVYQWTYANGAWQSRDLGSAPNGLYSLALGDGDHDFQLELYALAGDDHVYQFKAVHAQPTPTPTKTPMPDFDGQIISKKYIYAAPNPVRGHHANIVIHTLQPADVSAKLYTTTNKEVLSFRRHYAPGEHWERINISNLANGVYLLLVEARTNDGQEERVIKKIAIVK